MNKSSKSNIEIFGELHHLLKRHFKEEEVLYTKYRHKGGTILPILNTVAREHEMILHKVEGIRRALLKGEYVDLTGLYLALTRHKNIEEKLLYPELDNVLSEKEKEEAKRYLEKV
jgi:hemerythrin superfamily protein